MKKLTALFLCMGILFIMSAAGAAVPSISTSDTTQVVSITPSSDAVSHENFAIFPTEPKDPMKEAIKEMYDFVNVTSPSQALAGFFLPEDQAKLAEKIPAALTPDMLDVNEMTPLGIVNYDVEYGDVDVRFSFATEYEAGKAVVALLGLMDAQENFQWIALDAVAADDGDIVVKFTQEACLKMETAVEMVLIIFNEP